ncbi:hypothetical protein [Lelliottia wanjuensis]|uniref:hypothetical protein n=1 Tax=Lelliottia wanjuensis TaxID=3050585 RepID=UPI00254F52C2|nr:hypothetical protein [Lelliottia sp. V86_10]MDK9583176.1 hypothetical protein [Lelliottia sp. V86_10]
MKTIKHIALCFIFTSIACNATPLYSNSDLIRGYKADISSSTEIDPLVYANEFEGYMMGVAAALASMNEICLPDKEPIGYYITHNSYHDIKNINPDNNDAYQNAKIILIKNFPCNKN